MQQKPSIHKEWTPKHYTHPPRTELSKSTSLFSEALALHKVGRLAEAEQIYKKILATEPTHVGCLQLLGVISDQRGDHATAARQIESALKMDPDNVFALISRGNALHALKRFDEARLMTGMMSNSERTSTMTPIPGGGDIRSDGAGIFASS